MTTGRSLTPEPLTEPAWQPFGWLPVEDVDPRDGQHRLAFEWADAHVNLIHHDRNEAPATDSGLLCQMMFHHVTHTQALLVLNCPAVIAVAPAGTRFDDSADLDLVRAFSLRPLDALVLHRGCGTGAPSRSASHASTCTTCRGCATPRTTPASASTSAASPSRSSPRAEPSGARPANPLRSRSGLVDRPSRMAIMDRRAAVVRSRRR